MAVVRLLRFSHHRRQCAYWADRPQLNWGVRRQPGACDEAQHSQGLVRMRLLMGLWYRAASSLLICIALSACHNVTDVNSQLDIAISVDRLEITPTNPAHVTIGVENRGPDTVAIADPRSYACAAPYLVRDANDRAVALPPRTCLAILY